MKTLADPSRRITPRVSKKFVFGKDNNSNQVNTVTYEECKRLSKEYLLSNKIIFELHSEFNSII
jgi:hypothetical protein